MKQTLLFILLVLSTTSFAQNDPYLGIIPAPVSVTKSPGDFKLNPETIILVDTPDNKAVRFFNDYLKKAGYVNTVVDINRVDRKSYSMKNTMSLSSNFKGDLPAEGYKLQVSGLQIIVEGRGAGLFYGIQTLIQLIHGTSPGYANIPCAVIRDYPRFQYRGLHLDVARHFFDVDFIKKYLDLMAAYKLNNFHWHLTDDQGWRIEIKKYPKLTEIGSKRAQTKIGRATGGDSDLYDNTPYGGFYTQEQIEEVIHYAGDRYINIVPEIDMPGHSLAAIAAYPELSCDPAKTYKVGETWGVSQDVLCPTEETFKMMDDILLEVMELFPGKYIHIGGDECPKFAWKKSDFCRQLMSEQNLNDENGLQSYFTGRIEKFVNAQGRQIIGWDEILEGGLAPNATVMSWRGEGGGIAAAQLGHDVIMTPGSAGLYFDHAQSKSPQEPLSIGGNAPLSKTYAYDPVPAALSAEQQKHVIGVQANVWTEYIATPAKVEYMLLPRMFALSEIGWTPKENKDYKNFSQERVAKHLAKLDAAGFDYRVPVAYGADDTTVSGDKINVLLNVPVEGAKIYYTIDGYTPRETDLEYTAPLLFSIPEHKSIHLKTITVTPSGKRSIASDIKMTN
jgi:hexosaminidase